MIMSGNAPFSSANEAKTRNNIITCNFEFKPNDWEGISSEAKNWITKLFEMDPKERMTA